MLCLVRVLWYQKVVQHKLFCWEDQGTKLMVFEQVSWATDHRDTEAREREASLFEVRAIDSVNRCFESGSFTLSHVPACAEEDAYLWLAGVALSGWVPRT